MLIYSTCFVFAEALLWKELREFAPSSVNRAFRSNQDLVSRLPPSMCKCLVIRWENATVREEDASLFNRFDLDQFAVGELFGSVGLQEQVVASSQIQGLGFTHIKRGFVTSQLYLTGRSIRMSNGE